MKKPTFGEVIRASNFTVEAQYMKGNRARPVKSFFIVNSINRSPVVDAGYTIIAGVNFIVTLNSGIYYDPDKYPVQHYQWRLAALASCWEV